METDSDTEGYSEYKYYEVLAVCRERKTHSSGNKQEVGNRLVQDDINLVKGLPRYFIAHGAKVQRSSSMKHPLR